jgi:hypothetical protein
VRWFRNCDPAYAFLWEAEDQPSARWHASGRGPVHYLADTPAGAWAELVRHEAITDPLDLVDVRRALWAVEVPEDDLADAARPRLPRAVTTGGTDSYERCQAHAERLRAAGATALLAPSAALVAGAAGGHRTDHGLQRAAPADGRVAVLFGPRPDLLAWAAVIRAAPPVDLLPAVRHL